MLKILRAFGPLYFAAVLLTGCKTTSGADASAVKADAPTAVVSRCQDLAAPPCTGDCARLTALGYRREVAEQMLTAAPAVAQRVLANEQAPDARARTVYRGVPLSPEQIETTFDRNFANANPGQMYTTTDISQAAFYMWQHRDGTPSARGLGVLLEYQIPAFLGASSDNITWVYEMARDFDGDFRPFVSCYGLAQVRTPRGQAIRPRPPVEAIRWLTPTAVFAAPAAATAAN